ncbi:MAG: RluA family pseudouridine synthase [Firmicutes bacterium]|nr:RluA family pseudouridine synthase [Bacillota bacterium]
MENEFAGERIDLFLAIVLPDKSRSAIKKLVEAGLVRVGGDTCKVSHRLKAGDRVDLTIPPPGKLEALPEAIPLVVCYEDEDLVVVDKGAGLVVHPAPGTPSGTLVNALLHRYGEKGGLSEIGGVLRPGIVHRLDKDTSGLILVARNDRAHRVLAEALAAREIKRDYLALARGNPREAAGTIKAPVGRHHLDRQRMAVTLRGREATTHWRVLERFDQACMIKCSLETGRTHQIRVHLAHAGHPVMGDPVYGGKLEGEKVGLTRQALHAHRLVFQHPRTGDQMEFTSPLPPDLAKALEVLRKGLNRG